MEVQKDVKVVVKEEVQVVEVKVTAIAAVFVFIEEMAAAVV